MQLSQILFFIGLLIAYRIIFNLRERNHILFIISLGSIYWFQPLSTIRGLDFWLPSLLILFSVAVWGYLFGYKKFFENRNLIALGVIFLFFLFLMGTRWFNFTLIDKFIAVPQFHQILIFLALFLLAVYLISRLSEWKPLSLIMVFTVIFLLIILKFPSAVDWLSVFFRRVNQQSTLLASGSEIVWVGFSYFSFRLMHVLLEKNRFRQQEIPLNEFMIYLLYFPAFTAGPIARLDQFMQELRHQKEGKLSEDLLEGGLRIVRGLFYKFILADFLAMISIGSTPVDLVQKNGWVWIMVYAYSARIFLDFAGYTDIAIGLSRLAGIQLPENFNKPYRSPNLSVFWNRWHITLTQWFRTYYFNPIVRFFRGRSAPFSPTFLVLFSQLSTMILISLWHGISLNFIVWGLWHGLGLFIHNRWSEVIKSLIEKRIQLPSTSFSTAISIFLTVNYVTLGWIWFAMPDISDSLLIFQRLFTWS